ncbi:MAG: hypothetical protein IKD66_04775 [Solobacterium sp.]|nr:hypothetical protein [Solobacterium sp.]
MKKQKRRYSGIRALPFLWMMVLTLLITGCSGSSEQPVSSSDQNKAISPGNKSEWTIMFYLCGTDLESINGYASDNIYEILNAEMGDKVNFLIETGGTDTWWSDEISSDELQRFHVKDHKLHEDMSLDLASMGEPSTLSSFIRWGTENWPAEKYMIILWDHGGGSTSGICSDELFGDYLTLKELKTAVTEANVPIELVGMDACLMATLETAETFQGRGHYMVASEETIPGTGWAYDAFLNQLGKKPGMDGKALGTIIVDTYFEKLKKLDYGQEETLSLTDLTKVPLLSASFRDLSNELVLSTQNYESMNRITRGARKAENFGSNNDYDGYSNMVDLGSLLDNTREELHQADKVKKALKDAVVYEKHGEYRTNANGLSVMYPLYLDQETIELYSTATDNKAYLKYLSILDNNYDSDEWVNSWMEELGNGVKPGEYDSYFDSGIGDGGYEYEYDQDAINGLHNLNPVQESDYAIRYKTYIDEDGYYTLEITSGLEAVANVYYDFCMSLDEEGYLVLGKGSDIESDYENGIFSDNFRGVWLGFDDHLVYAEVIEETEQYTLYSIPVMYNDKRCLIKAAYDYDKGEYVVLGMYEGFDPKTGMLSRMVKNLEPGDHLGIVFPLYTWEEDSEVDGEYVLDEITWTKDTVFHEVELEDGEYFYNYVIEDVHGNVEFTGDAIAELYDGDITFYQLD